MDNADCWKSDSTWRFAITSVPSSSMTLVLKVWRFSANLKEGSRLILWRLRSDWLQGVERRLNAR